MFNSYVMCSALLALLILSNAGASSVRNVSIGGTVYEFIDADDKSSLHVSLNEDGSVPILLSDADLADLSHLFSLDSEKFLSHEQVEESLHTVQPIKPDIDAVAKSGTNPGTVLRLTKKGFDYGTQIGSKYLETSLRAMVIPDFESNEHKLKSRVHNLKLTQFAMPALGYRLISPNSLGFQSNGGSAAIRGDFALKKKILFWISVSGWFEASVSNLGLSIQTQFSKNSQGKPQISNVGCNANIGKLHFKIHGAGLLGWIANLFHGVIERYLKGKVQDLACKKIEQFGKERGNVFLSNMVTDAKLFDGLKLDYSLTGPPNVHEPFFDLPVKGETTMNGASSTPFSPDALELPPTESKMAAIFMSDYVLNSFLYQAHKAGRSQFQLDKNRKIVNFLRTSCDGSELCIGKLFPALEQKHPKTTGSLSVRTSTHPTMHFLPKRANLVADMVAELKFANETAFSFNVHGDFDLNSVQVTGADNRITAKAAINDLKVTNVQASVPDLIPVGQLSTGLVQLGKPIAQAVLNELGEHGFPLPAWRDLQLKNIDISFLQHTFSVACDILYSSI